MIAIHKEKGFRFKVLSFTDKTFCGIAEENSPGYWKKGERCINLRQDLFFLVMPWDRYTQLMDTKEKINNMLNLF